MSRREIHTGARLQPSAGRGRRSPIILVAVLLTGALAGCGTVNEKISSGAGDYIPQWAGGLPANAPPRPGTPEYEAWTQENNRRRAMPAAQREALEKSKPAAADTPH